MSLSEVCGFENLHLHTEIGSLLDGYGTVEEYVSRAKKINQQFFCVSDHGCMSAVPEQIATCEDYGVSPIFAMEFYVQDLQKHKDKLDSMSPLEKKAFRKSFHLLAIAYNEVGYSNLVQLHSWAHLQGFYMKPRVTHEQLMKHKEGLIFTSCCINGEIGNAFLDGGEEAGFAKLEQYMAMFGENFRLELMMIDYEKQKPYDAFLIKAHNKYKIPLIITCDTHYANPEDSLYQRYMLMMQTGRTIKDIQNALELGDGNSAFELQDKNLWMKSEDEMNQKWLSDYKNIIPLELFQQAKRNTVSLCHKAKGVELDKCLKLPFYGEDPDKILLEEIHKGLNSRKLFGDKNYEKRAMYEYGIITRKGFASYFLITKQFTTEARRYWASILGYGSGSSAVGPARGSGGGSLVNYLLKITDVDPIKHNLLFSRFLSENRGGKIMKVRFPDEIFN